VTFEAAVQAQRSRGPEDTSRCTVVLLPCDLSVREQAVCTAVHLQSKADAWPWSSDFYGDPRTATPSPLGALDTGPWRVQQPERSRKMSRDAPVTESIVLLASDGPTPRRTAQSSRMQYRSRPVSVAVDPISLVISECITITSAIQKYARSTHSSVSAILGGSPNLVQLGAPSSHRVRGSGGKGVGGTSANGEDSGPSNRWGLRGKKGKSMQDNPLISGFGRLRQELTGVQGELRQGNQDFMSLLEQVFRSGY
jgi:hypothetical protein